MLIQSSTTSVKSEGSTYYDREEESVPTNIETPFDFSALDDLYHYADRYAHIADRMIEQLTTLEEAAWTTVDALTPDNTEQYLRTYIIAVWRTVELDYIKEAGIRRSRVASFRQAITLKVLLDGQEVGEDFLAVISQYQRDVVLQKISRASAAWLTKYGVKLAYDSDYQYGYTDWKIFIDPQANPT